MSWGRLLDRAGWPDPVVGADEAAGWPASEFTTFVRLGLVSEVSLATAVRCDGCSGDHVEPVEWVDVPGRSARAFVRCPEQGHVLVDPARLRRWVVSRRALAGRIAEAVGAVGEVEERIAGRVWALGRVRVGDRGRPLFLVCGPVTPDLGDRVPELVTPTAVALVPTTLSSPAVWGPARPPLELSVADHFALGADRLIVDRGFWSELAPLAVRAPLTAAVFPVPPGARWADVSLTVGDHHLRVRVGDISRVFGFAEAGFEDRRRGGVPNHLWTLLRVFARTADPATATDRRTPPSNFKQQVSGLRQVLKALIPIPADPFQAVRGAGRYRPRFRLTTAGPADLLLPADLSWADLTLTEVEPGTVEIAHPVRVVGAAGGEAVETVETERRRVGVSGWRLSPAAADALRGVLRGEGRMTGPADHRGLLALGQSLTAVFGLTGPPFAFDSAAGVWATVFEAASLVPPSER